MITQLHGDCLELLETLPAESVQTIVTSPPYWQLRRYTDDPREIGREATPAAYVAALVAVFRACRRVLRRDGTLWVNISDSYAGKASRAHEGMAALGSQYRGGGKKQPTIDKPARPSAGIPDKNLMGMPWRVAFALQDAGWILRSDIIWSKPNCMPESVTDRPTRAHEYVFLFAKQARYFYDAAAIAEAVTGHDPGTRGAAPDHKLPPETTNGRNGSTLKDPDRVTRNARSVWTIATQPLADEHYAAMPLALADRCIRAGSSAQACETCGAAWGRVVEKESKEGKDRDPDPAMTAGPMARPGKNGANHSQFVKSRMGDCAVTTIGFAPRCACAVNAGAGRSIVLDPFAGSGTTLRAAVAISRDAIGIDLAYQDMQERRTNGVQIELL